MNIEKKFDIKEIIRQEVNICGALFNNEDFKTLSITGNRIMENCIFSDDYRLFLPGFLIKELSLIYSSIFRSQEPKAFQTAKLVGNEFINFLKEILKKGLDEELIWTKYHLFIIKIQEFLQSESEKKYYENNIEYSSYVLVYLIDFLKKNEEILYEEYNQILVTILSVLDRIFRAHSGSLEFTLINSYLKMLIRLYGYLLIKYYKEEEIDKENLKKELDNHLKYIFGLDLGEKINIEDLDKKLWEVIKEWRFYYLYYRSPPTYQVSPPQRVIELP